MTTEATARLGLPLLAPGQAQKELFHNEALAAIDIAAQASVRGVGLNTAPVEPNEGDCWVLGDAPTGEWAGHAAAIAGWTTGGWRFIAAREGLAAWDLSSGWQVRHVAGHWSAGTLNGDAVVVAGQQVVGPRQPPISPPQGGATVDVEARRVLADLLSSLQLHGLIGS